MEPTVYSVFQRTTAEKQGKKRQLLKYSALSTLLMLIVLVSLFYFTPSGHQLRRMLAGSILSSQHPQYALFLLSQSEINELKDLIAHPPSVRSTLAPLSSASSSENLVRVETVETSNYTAKIMIVSDPTTIHLVGTRFKNRGEPLSDLIREHGGIAGINAGGFEDDNGIGSGGQPIGIAIGDSQILASPNGDRSQPMLIGGFTKDGEFITGSYSIKELLQLNVTQAVSFGPQLLIDGENKVTPSVNAAYGWAPRTALGQAADGTVVMIITDGRYFQDKRHRGASMDDLVELFQRYQVRNAFALDGGGSTTMIYNGELQMQPATFSDIGMRYLPNAFIVIPHENDGKYTPAVPQPGEDRPPAYSVPSPTQKPTSKPAPKTPPRSNETTQPVSNQVYGAKTAK